MQNLSAKMEDLEQQLQELSQKNKDLTELVLSLQQDLKELQEKRVIFKKPEKRDFYFYLHKDLELEKQKAIDLTTDFFNHYDSNGWMVGKTKMKDWKAAARKWAKKNHTNTKNLFNGKEHQPAAGRKPLPTGAITPGGFKGL